jgi:hypothetical protein
MKPAPPVTKQHEPSSMRSKSEDINQRPERKKKRVSLPYSSSSTAR